MEKRVLLFLLSLLVGATAYAQVAPAFGSLRGLSVASASAFVSEGKNTISGEVAAPNATKGLKVRASAQARQNQKDVARIYDELARQKPTSTIAGASLGKSSLSPGVYHVSGNAQVEKVLKLVTGKQLDGIFVFQVAGDLTLAPAAAVLLDENVRSKNIYWQVAGKVKLGKGSALQGAVLAAGDIVTEPGAVVLGSLWSKGGTVTMNNTVLEGPFYSDMEVKQVISPGPYSRGDKVKYTITLKNQGPDDNKKVILKFGGLGMSMVGPPKTLYHFSGQDPGAAEYNLTSNGITWTYFPGKFPAGDSVVYEVTISIDQTEFSTSILTVLGDNVDEKIINNSIEKSLCATPPAPGAIKGKASLCINSTGNVFEVADMLEARKFNWTVPNGWVITSGGSSNRIVVTTSGVQADGLITVKAENACGESAASTFQVSTVAVPPPMPKEISGNSGVCVGERNLLYSIEDVPGAVSYAWSLPAGWAIVEGAGTKAIKVNPGTSGGTLRVTAENGCGASASSQLEVFVSPAVPAAPAGIVGEAVVCATGGTVTYRIAQVQHATNYTWAVSGGWEIISGNGTNAVVVRPGVGEGNITVRAMNACGISSPVALAVRGITEDPVLGAITGNAEVCFSTALQTYAVAEVVGVAKYIWSVPAGWDIVSGQNSNQITVKTNTAGGVVSVTATGVCGTEAQASLPVAISMKAPDAPLAINGVAAPCIGSNGVVYQIAEVAGASGYTWEVPAGWMISSGQGGTSITVQVGATAGRVSVYAANFCGKSTLTTLAVTPAALVPATPTILGEAVPCLGKQFTYTTSTPLAGHEYEWELPQNWRIVSGQGTAAVTVVAGATPGQIKVKVRNGCGESAVGILAVAPSDGVPIIASEIKGPLAICAGSTEPFTYSIDAVVGASAYTWTIPSGWVFVSNEETKITVRPGASPGNITVKAVNGCGLSSVKTLAVVVSSAIAPTPSQIEGLATLCSQAETTYSVSAVAGATTYEWVYPANWTMVKGQGTASLTVKVGSSGTVSVMARNGCGESASVNKLVTVLPTEFQTGKITGEAMVCATGADQTFSIEAVVGATSYQWSVPAGWQILSGNNTRSIRVRIGASGEISVVASTSCATGSRSSLAVSLSTQAPTTPAAITFTSTGSAPCVGQEQIIVYQVGAVTGAQEYVWTVPAGWAIVSGQGTTSLTVKVGTVAGQVSVVAKNGCGQSAASALAATPVTNNPSGPLIINGEVVPCAAKTQIFAVKEPETGANYTWNLPAGWNFVSGQGTATITVLVGTGAGEVKVQGTNTCGTVKEATFAASPSSGVPAFLSDIQGPASFCTGTASTVQYQISATSGASGYQWEVPNGWQIVSGQGTIRITVIPGTASGEVQVSAFNGCGQTTTQRLPVDVSPATLASPVFAAGEKDVCTTTTQVVYSIMPVEGAKEYEWKVPAGWAILQGEGTTAVTVQVGTAPGRISVLAKNSCTKSQEVFVDVTLSSFAPAALGEITGPAAACSGQRYTYSVAAINGAAFYQWSIPANWVYVAGQGTTSITVLAGATSGPVSVTAKNGCGNSTNTSNKPVQSQNSNLGTPSVIQVGASHLTPCVGQAGLVFKVDLVPGATSYEWSFPADWTVQAGQGTGTITLVAGKAAGEVRVVAKNTCGVSEGRAVAVTPKAEAPLVPGEIIGTKAVCANSSPVTYQVAGVTGAATYAWSVPAGWIVVSGQGTTTLAVIPTSNGTIEFTATNTCGGQTKKSLAVELSNDAELPALAITGPQAFCLGTAAQVYEIAPVSGATYSWQLPAGWQVVSGAGTHKVTLAAQTAGPSEIKVTVRNACGKSASAAVQVLVAPALAEKTIIKDESTVCVGYQFSAPLQANVTYTWHINGNKADWTITEGQGTNQIKVQGPPNERFSPAQVSVVVSNQGCSSASDVYEVQPTLQAPELSVPNTFSPNNDGTNDQWVIQNLLSYSTNEVVVLNRWGSEVFRQRGYKNNWNGGGLAAGTYYYYAKVRLCNNEEVTLKGYVLLVR